MSDQINTTETEFTAEEEINELNKEGETQASRRQARREKVFKACDQLEQEGINITRDNVLKISGGSCRDLSGYIEEWRQSKKNKDDSIDDATNTTEATNTSSALVAQGSNEMVQSRNENNIQTSPEVLETTPINDYDDPDNTADMAISAVKRVKGMILTEEKIMQHFFKNPDQMPEKFKQEIAQAKSETKAMINERSATFEVDFFMKKALMSLEK